MTRAAGSTKKPDSPETLALLESPRMPLTRSASEPLQWDVVAPVATMPFVFAELRQRRGRLACEPSAPDARSGPIGGTLRDFSVVAYTAVPTYIETANLAAASRDSPAATAAARTLRLKTEWYDHVRERPDLNHYESGAVWKKQDRGHLFASLALLDACIADDIFLDDDMAWPIDVHLWRALALEEANVSWPDICDAYKMSYERKCLVESPWRREVVALRGDFLLRVGQRVAAKDVYRKALFLASGQELFGRSVSAIWQLQKESKDTVSRIPEKTGEIMFFYLPVNLKYCIDVFSAGFSLRDLAPIDPRFF